MSKRLPLRVDCPKCGLGHVFEAYRSVWAETSGNREMVFSCEVNVFTCPQCDARVYVPFPFMYVDMKNNFAVWWEPMHDPTIDRDRDDYERCFGEGNFYAAAPRIQRYDIFLKVISEFESGMRVGKPISLNPQEIALSFRDATSSETAKNGRSGCFGGIAFIMVVIVLMVHVFYEVRMQGFSIIHEQAPHFSTATEQESG